MNRLKIFMVIIIAMCTNYQLQAADNLTGVQNRFKQYFAKTSADVKNAGNPSAKREILNNSFDNVRSVLGKVSLLPGISDQDKSAVNSISKSVEEKQYELNGLNGYERVDDSKLNDFADYVRQDMEQAETWVTVSITTLLLAAILLLLIVK
ncbi:MAG: hypothetical protein ACM3SM_11185 [Bacteroidota bacterium]